MSTPSPSIPAGRPLDYVSPPRESQAEADHRAGVSHAKLIGLLTLVSRILGMAREVVAARFFGAGVVWSAFQYAFTIPNLFRKLLGEGALSAAFIPLYAKALKHETKEGEASEFASASVSLLIAILLGITVVGELVLLAVLYLADLREGTQLAVKLTIVMLPYVVFVCAAAFVGGILQVHRRFSAPAIVPVVSNLLMIATLAAVALTHDLRTEAGQRAAESVMLSAANPVVARIDHSSVPRTVASWRRRCSSATRRLSLSTTTGGATVNTDAIVCGKGAATMRA